MLTVNESTGLAKKVIPGFDKLDEGSQAIYLAAAGLCEKAEILKKVYEIAKRKFRWNIFRKKDASHPGIRDDMLYLSLLASCFKTLY